MQVAVDLQMACMPQMANYGAMHNCVQVENLGLAEATVAALKNRGIHSLFSIQKAVLQPGMEGRDMIGRAKTGSGKTLAFALPVIESLITVSLPAWMGKV